ncbi:MAG: hypothetical protein JST73_01755 [Actinobacteria bacterium]|nr:hypothetical protein [Actinomycetota bacterium]
MISVQHGRRIATAALGAILAIGATSCGAAANKVADKAVEHETGAKVDSKNGNVNIKTKDGEFSTQSTKELPSGWPSDILAVPHGFTVSNVTQTKTAQGAAQLVTATGKGEAGALVDSFAKQFKAKGLDVSMQTTSGDGGMVIAQKDDNSYSVTISQEGDGLSLLMSYTKSPSSTTTG